MAFYNHIHNTFTHRDDEGMPHVTRALPTGARPQMPEATKEEEPVVRAQVITTVRKARAPSPPVVSYTRSWAPEWVYK